jgi:hypothetical protein
VQLEAYSVVPEGMAGEPRPAERVLALSHEGSCGQVSNQHFICLAPIFSDPWPEPVNQTRHRGRVTSHPVAAGDGRTIIPHAQGIGLGKAGPTLIAACRSHEGKRPTDPDPARMIKPRGYLSSALVRQS